MEPTTFGFPDLSKWEANALTHLATPIGMDMTRWLNKIYSMTYKIDSFHYLSGISGHGAGAPGLPVEAAL